MVKPEQPSSRWPAFLFFALFVAGGALLVFMALAGLLPPLKALRTGAALVGFRPRDAVAIGPALSLFAFAAMTLLPDRRAAGGPKRRAPQKRASMDAAACLLAIAFIGIALSFAAAPMSEIAFDRFAQNRGYSRCPAPKVWDRHAPLRWALPGASCP